MLALFLGAFALLLGAFALLLGAFALLLGTFVLFLGALALRLCLPQLLARTIVRDEQLGRGSDQPGVERVTVHRLSAEMHALEGAGIVPTPELERHRAPERARPLEQRIEYQELLD